MIAIGLDAGDPKHLRRLLEAGELPALAALARCGSWIEIEPEWPGIVTDPWSSFVRERPLGDHGRFFVRLWDAGRGRPVPLERWPEGRVTPPWHGMRQRGGRVVLIDVPYLPVPAEAAADVVLTGWQAHDRMERLVHPGDALGTDRVPDPASHLGSEPYGAVDDGALLELARRCRETPVAMAETAVELLRRHDPDLLLLVFGALHRAGHYLQAPDALARVGLISPQCAEKVGDALDDVWRSVDRAIGRLQEASGERSVVVFGLHGMTVETPWTEHLDQLLAFCDGRPVGGRADGWLARLRRSHLALRLDRHLPSGMREALAALAWRRLHDWSNTKIFPIPNEGVGALRLNLRGRERYGVVEPGAEARAVLEETAERLAGLRELASDQPLVERILRVDDHVPAEAPGRATLPDLVVQWRAQPWWACAGVRDRQGRELRFEAVPVTSSGRTGAHRPGGFAIVPAELAPHLPSRSTDLLAWAGWLGRLPGPGPLATMAGR